MHTEGGWVSVNVRPAIVRSALREAWVALGNAVIVVVPLPKPCAGENESQDAAVVGVQLHELDAVTVAVDVPPLTAKDVADNETTD